MPISKATWLLLLALLAACSNSDATVGTGLDSGSDIGQDSSSHPDASTDEQLQTDNRQSDSDTSSTDVDTKECIPECEGKECGDDGCGGSCGECGQDAPICADGVCGIDCISEEGCDKAGLAKCLSLEQFVACEEVEANCFRWGTPENCGEGEHCLGGECVDVSVECGDAPASVNGIAENPASNIDYSGNLVEVSLTHTLDIDAEEDGCLSGLDIAISIAEMGCRLHLRMETDSGHQMMATEATLEADSFCPGWSDEDEGDYILKSSSLVSCIDAQIVGQMVESACIPNVTIHFSGSLQLERQSDSRQIELNLSQLTLQGDVNSTGDPGATCPDLCIGKECGDNGCGGDCGDCGIPQGICVGGQCVCQPDCEGKTCGSDGCGGYCGICSCGYECDGSQCLHIACLDKQCGDDGCGGNCGSCLCGHDCQDGQCVFTACDGKECGNDGCGGECGMCQPPLVCSFLYACVDLCENNECGPDGFGGSCGTCEEGVECCIGRCACPTWQDPTTGIIWQNPPAEEIMNRDEALDYCEGLELDGATDWELPSIDLLRTLVRGCPNTTWPDGICAVAENQCLLLSCFDISCACEFLEGPSNGCYWPIDMLGDCSLFTWSSSEVEDVETKEWISIYSSASISYISLSNYGVVRCIRQ